MGSSKSNLVEVFVTRSATEWSGVVRKAVGLTNPQMLQAGSRLWSLNLLPSSSFPLRGGGVIRKVHRVSMPDRCRRLNACLAMSPRTSSYPDSWHESQRPLCHTCVTAATGGSAPSNRRAGLAPTSSGCGQEPPGRKFAHALFSGNGQNQIRG
jgi:hypothetical protein